jgi:site-specific recombinase XerC
VTFVDREEIAALLAAPDRSTWGGRRDHTILVVALQTGLRASELINLRCRDVVLGTGAHIRCDGKGRKERCTPLRRDTVNLLEQWLRERRGGDDQPLFPSMRGDQLSRDALEHLVRRHVGVASASCPSLGAKRVSPHVLRHSTAMELLQHGVDQTVIALWLGHESVETTQIYIHADLRMKEKALSRIATPDSASPNAQRNLDGEAAASPLPLSGRQILDSRHAHLRQRALPNIGSKSHESTRAEPCEGRDGAHEAAPSLSETSVAATRRASLCRFGSRTLNLD